MGNKSFVYPLTWPQEILQARGPNSQWFLSVPQEVYIAAIEEISSRLPHKEAAEFRAETSQAIRKNCPSQPNTSQEESKAIKEFRKDSSRVILTANKGVAMVVVDRQDYLNNTQDLLEDRKTYRPITMEPMSRLKTNSYKL